MKPQSSFSCPTIYILFLLAVAGNAGSIDLDSASDRVPSTTSIASAETPPSLGRQQVVHHANKHDHHLHLHRRREEINEHRSPKDAGVIQNHHHPRDLLPSINPVVDTALAGINSVLTDIIPGQSSNTPSPTDSNADATVTTTVTSTIYANTVTMPSTASNMTTTAAATTTSAPPGSTNTTSPQTSTNTTSPGLISAVYYVNWAIYARNFFINQLPASQFSHVLYAFAGVRADTGEVYLTDPNADTNKKFPSDNKKESGFNLYGCAKQLLRLKRANRQVKTLLSVGGASLSVNITPAISTADGRSKFANSAVNLLEDLGFDGIDVDYEFPTNATQAANHVDLLRLCRLALDAAAANRTSPTRFYLTAAVPAGPSNYKQLRVKDMDQYLDFWNLMAYDYAGSWSTLAGHQANLYPNAANKKMTPYSSSAAMEFYIGQGVAPRKMVLGMPLYGRQFTNTDGIATPYNGTGPGSWQSGIWDYKALPLSTGNVTNDPNIGATLSYEPVNRTLITFDDVVAARQKADYVLNRGLGGGMWWESSGDKPVGNGSLVEAFVNEMGGTSALDQTNNCLDYPYSKYDNVRNGSIQ